MATLSPVSYQIGTEVLQEAANAATDSWRLILSNTAPNVATNTTAASATELSTGGGYTAGGVACTVTSSTQTAGVFTLTLEAPASPTWTASGGGFTFRYVILYNLTNTQCIWYWDRGSATVLAAGDTYTPTLNAGSGTYTVTATT
jgi:hypothetical protein